MRRFTFAAILVTLFLVAWQSQSTAQSRPQKPAIKALIVDGQSSIYHKDWAERTAVMKQMLEQAGIFTVAVATSPAIGEDNSKFLPKFADYDVVIVNYEGDYWSDAMQKSFEDYIRGGGGLVTLHATDNAFPDWKAWNEMIGVGGWGRRTAENGGVIRNRDESDGAYLRLREGKWVRDTAYTGRAGSHGSRHRFKMEAQAPEHPVMKGLPAAWMNDADDELYDQMRGPAENVTVLAAAYSDPATYSDPSKAPKEYEPILMAISYGKGRVFHSTLGHNVAAMGAAFKGTFQRGVEWAATGAVTQKLPADFPANTP
jgi:type 1 glutamine amidotransferase